MDHALWLRCLSLPHRLRAQWVRGFLEQGHVPDAVARVPATNVLFTPDILDRLCRPHDVRWITPLDAEYPRVALGGLHDPPAVLYLRGDVSLLEDTPRVAIVGARRGTARGRRTATQLGATLAQAGVSVVSGLALGIDAAAHTGCLDAEGRAIAVLPRGLDLAYPASHARLYRRILARGLSVSEYPPGTTARREQFVARNRIVAALAASVVVVEASAQSGALHTVEFAHQIGREVMAVPGPVDCPHAEGTLQLLRDGATLVRDGRDVLESMGLAALPAATGPLGLGARPQTALEIARRLGWTLPRVLVALGEAEVFDQVERVGADRWAARSSLRPGREGT